MQTNKSILGVALSIALLATTADAGSPMKAGGVRHMAARHGVRTVGHHHRGGGRQFGVGGFGGFGYGSFGPVGGFTPYSSGRIPTPPYFSLHPPVYYSAPVPRTYGYSPFAYPGSVRTPEVVLPMVQPQVIDNQFCPAALKKLEQTEREQKKEVENDGFASTAQWIGNPFVRLINEEAVEAAPIIVAN